MNIANFDKAEVLAALYNNATVRGWSEADLSEMTKDEAAKILEESHDKYFDYLKGRVMKISLAKDEVETRLYNRDNGHGAAEDVLEWLAKKEE